MSSLELNKIFGAILLAGLVGTLSAFIAEKLVEPKPLAKPVYVVQTAPADSGAAKPAAEPAGPAPIAPLLAVADPANGQKVTKVCQTCHNFDKGGPNKIGPNLWGIVGDKQAHLPSFAYSDAVAKLGGTWTYDELNKFLYSPKAYAPGTKMTFAGLKNDKERADAIAWLRTQNDNPPPLPQ
ncbi:MAG: cytochrome c family protein [Azospirillaceae bacterium]|nr:cytochrome c family protein [Azospirillaceae bacterium]